MRQLYKSVLLICVGAGTSLAQNSVAEGDFQLALPSHTGQLAWHAEGFKVIESSAQQNGNEIGLRGKDAPGRLAFLGFLFLFSDQAPLTSAKCRDGVMEPEKKSNPGLRILANSEIARPDGQQIALVRYTSEDRNKKTTYMTRGFVAAGDLCGDLEFYGDAPNDKELQKIFASFRLDPQYAPQFQDLLLYAQVLYGHRMYKAAAPIFEQALSRLKDDDAPQTRTMRRVTTDQAGMAYGMSGDVAKARTIFVAAIAKDPDYPLYYYNLACADAEQKNLKDAEQHLQQAFARKANVISGEKIPDPTKDDSFLQHRDNKEFWKFVETLR